ncbi:hypothetical protein CEXT_294401 [Caerostris extrusa]|uniref:Uncharacterized protein n=1 Tax=Caerostris extrusa TaxID=172846 RepID=A0AAV4NUV7_CAEEX|nr:hypothetical protein CEXT_294401 [Caerostris extrusa]
MRLSPDIVQVIPITDVLSTEDNIGGRFIIIHPMKSQEQYSIVFQYPLFAMQLVSSEEEQYSIVFQYPLFAMQLVSSEGGLEDLLVTTAWRRELKAAIR